MNRKIFISAVIAVVLAAAAVIFYRASAPDIIIIDPTDQNEVAVSDLLSEKYTNSRLGFTIHPPESWAVDESGQLGTFAVFVPENPGEEDVLTSISIITEPASHLEDYVRETRSRLPEILEDFTQIENQRVALGESEGHLIGGTFTFNELSVRTLRLIVARGGRGYNVTATALQSIWADRKDMLEQSLLTFRP